MALFRYTLAVLLQVEDLLDQRRHILPEFPQDAHALVRHVADLHRLVQDCTQVALRVEEGVLRLQVVLQQDDVLVAERVDELPVHQVRFPGVKEDEAVHEDEECDIILQDGFSGVAETSHLLHDILMAEDDGSCFDVALPKAG